MFMIHVPDRFESKLEEVSDLEVRLRKSEETVKSLEKELRSGATSNAADSVSSEEVNRIKTLLSNKEHELEHLRVSLRQYQVSIHFSPLDFQHRKRWEPF